MNGPKFFETGYGRRFFDGQLPKLIENIGNVAVELKRANDLKEKEVYANQKANSTQEKMD
jgi:hypothetical protein